MFRRISGISETAVSREAKVVSAAFVTMAILAAVLIGISAVAGYFRASFAAKGAQSRDTRKDSFVFGTTIGHRIHRAEIAAGSEQVLDLSRISGKTAASLSTEMLDNTLSFLRLHSFTYIEIDRSDGIVLRSGTPLAASITSLPVKSQFQSRLLWKDGFYIETKHVLRGSDGGISGTMIAQSRIPLLDELFKQDLTDGKTNDMMLCAPSVDGAICLASRSHSGPFLLSSGSVQELQLIQAAFAGTRSTKFWIRTEGGWLVVSSAPAAGTDLALAKTVAVREALIPFFAQVGGTVFIITLLILLGRFLLGKGIRPLVHALVAEKELASVNEQRFIAAAESGLSSFFIFESVRNDADEIVDFRFVYVNHHAERLIGRSSQSVFGKLLCVEIPINRTGGFFDKYKTVVETGVPVNEEAAISAGNVNATWLQYQGVRLGDGVALTVSDISARKKAELELETALRFTEAVVAGSSFSTIVTDLAGTIVAVNPAAERMLWYSKDELLGRTPILIHDPVEVKLRAEELTQELGVTVNPTMDVFTAKAAKGLTDEGRWTYIRKDGSKLPVQLTVTALTDEQGKATGYMGVAYDITERKRQEDYISHIAHHDSLTGLPTRLLFRDRVDVALNRLQRYGGKCAVMLIDLDNFKDINDSLGHHAGDELLVTVAKRLTEVLRLTDTISRMGGDEFTVLLDQILSEDDAIVAAKKVLEGLAKPIRIGGETLSISASIGISLYPEGGTTAAALVQHADAAMYDAKGSGKHRYRIFTQGLADATTKRLLLEMSLKKAMEAKEFSVVYQPQVALESGMIVGVEALLRWTNPKLGDVSPADFIPVAEQCGLIGTLGEWVLKTACGDINSISKATGYDLKLAVNLSPRQLEIEGLARKVATILDEAPFPAGSLEIEITEGVLMNDSSLAWESLKELRALGVKTAIDDFGTGFSNVSYLLKLAVNRIKIDQSFVACLETDPGCKAVVSSLIGMAGSLGVCVLAEGVETAAQRDFLRAKGCQEAQGYFFHRPMSATELVKIL